MNLRQVHKEISVADSELTMAWCRRYGLLKTERTCMRCRNVMRLVVRSGIDGTRRKYNRGRMIREQWVFGGIDTQTKAGFMVPVDRRDADTLLPIIQQFILPGTTIVSDLWGAYNTVGNLGYAHLTVNHSVNFVDPITFAHTNAVENFWMRSKFRSKKGRGTSANLLPSYLQEFVAANF